MMMGNFETKHIDALLALLADPARFKAQLAELKAAREALKTATVEHKRAAADTEAKLAALAAHAEEGRREDEQRQADRDRISERERVVERKLQAADGILARERALSDGEAALKVKAEALQRREAEMRARVAATVRELVEAGG